MERDGPPRGLSEGHGSDSDEEDCSAASSRANPNERDRQLAALQQLDDIIRKETHHVLPIMESRQGFTNLTANVQRISQAGRDAVSWSRACLRDGAGARAEAERAAAAQRRLEAEAARLQAELREQERQTASARADADASRGREQDTLVLLEELRCEVRRQRSRAENLAALQQQQGLAADGSDGNRDEMEDRRRLARDQGLAEEVACLKELLRAAYNDHESIERRASFAKLRANKLADELSAAQAAHALEVRLRENLEHDVKLQRLTADTRAHEMESLQAVLDASRERVELQEKMLRDAAAREDRLRKRADQTQRLLERSEQQVHGLQQLLDRRGQCAEEQRSQLQVAQEELARQRRQLAALEKARDAAGAALRQQDARAQAMQRERDDTAAEVADLRRTLETVRAQLAAEERRAGQLTARAVEMESRRARISRVADQQARVLRSKQKLWDDLSREYAQCRKRVRQEEGARDKLCREKQQLSATLHDKEMRLEEAAEDQRLQQLQLAACQREVAECSSQQLKLCAQLDGLRSQLSAAGRDLTEQREHTLAATARIQTLDAANEQLKEEAATKEKQSVQLERLLARTRTETHHLRAEVQRLESKAAGLCAEVASLTAECARLTEGLRRADAERASLRRERAASMDERDVIATMLVRRNDEVSLLRDKGRLLEVSLQQGRRALLATEEDVRLLRIEVRRLRGERRQLAAHASNTPGLRAELLRALRDLGRDRVRLRALQDELSCPLNVHRWRRLEGTDPPAHELLVKVHILQKRILRLSAASLQREAQLRHTEHLYMALRRAVCPSEGMPAPHGVPRHMRLAARGRHLKSLIAEVSALEALADQKAGTRLLAGLHPIPRRRLPLADGDGPDGRKRKASDGHCGCVPDEGPRAKQPSPRPSPSPSPSPPPSPAPSPPSTPLSPPPSPPVGAGLTLLLPPSGRSSQPPPHSECLPRSPTPT